MASPYRFQSGRLESWLLTSRETISADPREHP